MGSFIVPDLEIAELIISIASILNLVTWLYVCMPPASFDRLADTVVDSRSTTCRPSDTRDRMQLRSQSEDLKSDQKECIESVRWLDLFSTNRNTDSACTKENRRRRWSWKFSSVLNILALDNFRVVGLCDALLRTRDSWASCSNETSSQSLRFYS